MLKNLGIVQASFHWPRFRSNAVRKLGGRPVFEWVIRRVTEAMHLNGVIVLASNVDDRDFVHHMVPRDVPVFFGEGDDLLVQFTKALEKYPAEGAVRVLGDNIFVDPGLIDCLLSTVDASPNCDYVSYRSRNGQPAILSPVDMFAEWFRTSALRKADRLAHDELDRRHVTRYLYSHPEKFDLRLVPVPAEIDRDDLRLTIDIDEDWDHVLSIFDALGPERLDWRGITRLLDHQPAMRTRMAALNRAHQRPAALAAR